MKTEFKIVCPHCQKDFISNSLLKSRSEYFFKCVHCGKDVSIDIVESQEIEKEQKIKEDPSGDVCPKCGAERILGDISCAKCGLVYEKWKGAKTPFSKFPDLKKEWKSLKKIPIESEEHFAFLEKCFNAGALHSAVRAYKLLGSEKDIDVSQKIGQLNILAQMSISKKSSAKKNSSLKIIFMIILTVLFMIICFYLLSINPEDLL